MDSQSLAALLGPPLYGLPYRLARVRYRTNPTACRSHHEIQSRHRLAFNVAADPEQEARAACPGTLDEFLVERYVAFTHWQGVSRRFEVGHAPWPQRRAVPTMIQTELLESLALPINARQPVCAHLSPGVNGVWLSRPLPLAHGQQHQHQARPASLAIAWLPLAILPVLASARGRHLPPWVFMWLMATALWAGCKWQSWWLEAARLNARHGRNLGYLLTWPGMNARSFLSNARGPVCPQAGEWARASVNLATGAALLWLVCRRIPARHPLAMGWIGMIGLILLLHFGIFYALSLVWRANGVDAKPLMDKPLATTSLADFWGHRWNAGFHDLARRLVFRPLVGIAGARAALLATFVVSGLIHELVISLPAASGYGLPTAYFTIQGAGILIQRGSLARELRLDRGIRARAFTVAFTALPVFWLFHPTFVARVIVPFLRAIGATHLGGVS